MTLVDEELLVKSRERVKSYGEVFTPRHMVEQMLDLVSDDLDGPGFVDKTFLEPAAGDGNFLIAILRRKLAAVEKTIEPALWPQESLFVLASIYGIELLEDNHQDAQALMLAEFIDFHQRHGVACGPRTHLHRAAAFLIATNIVRGNTLTGQDWRGEDIEFSWWNRDPDQPGVVRREPFTFFSLREESMFDLAVYAMYAPCPINQVHQEVRSDG
ncbi:MAG: SAM-dependent DNA methyltransferase [Nostocoides sp.]|uniref:SAM-dependent DNA methyltransferase n=1 Tax=Nostocoides sp. TaxID=1917966 RepID=UPI003C756AB9